MTKKTYLKTVLAVGFALFKSPRPSLSLTASPLKQWPYWPGPCVEWEQPSPPSLLIIAVTRCTHQAETTPEPPPRFTQPVVFTVPPMQIQQPPTRHTAAGHVGERAAPAALYGCWRDGGGGVS